MLGKYQVENSATAVAAMEVLQQIGVRITTNAIKKGIHRAKWPGRFDIVRKNPTVILDCAHNPDGARVLKESLKELDPNRLTLVIGTLKDKDIEGISGQLGPLVDKLVVTMPDTPRACKSSQVKKAFEPHVETMEVINDVGKAVEYAISSAQIDDSICITGSIYTVGEAMIAMRDMNIKKIGDVMEVLREEYKMGAFPGKDVAATTLKREERHPFRVLMATILSHRTRDENTHLAVERLFKRFNTPEKIARANVKEIEKLIRPAGFYNVKARRLKEVSKILIDKFNGEVPKDFDELMSLPSVGRKTANCVLVYGFGIDAIPVDTHVHRISNRLGLVQTLTPEETEGALASYVPRKYWIDLNELFVKFGQDTCRPIGPKCNACPLNDVCEYYRLKKNNED
jgi:endonuclease-3